MENLKLVARAKEGEEYAIEQLYENHRRMVYQYVYQYSNLKEDREDLESIGKICFMKCLDKFDLDSNTKFSTYLNNALSKDFTQEYINKNRAKRGSKETTLSLEYKCIDDGSTIGDSIPTEDNLNNFYYKEMRSSIEEIINKSSFTAEQKKALIMYLDGKDGPTIGEELEKTRAWASRTRKNFQRMYGDKLREIILG